MLLLRDEARHELEGLAGHAASSCSAELWFVGCSAFLSERCPELEGAGDITSDNAECAAVAKAVPSAFAGSHPWCMDVPAAMRLQLQRESPLSATKIIAHIFRRQPLVVDATDLPEALPAC